MKVGDLVEIKTSERLECTKRLEHHHPPPGKCLCWFCYNNSSGVGTVLEQCPPTHIDPDGLYIHSLEWIVLFDAGTYEVYESEVKVINE